MIFNGYTVIALFISAITGVLAFILCLFSFRVYQRWNDRERSRIEDRSYLLLLIATVALLVKLLSWPIFYVTLWSYIPYIQGAMCIFGATQAQPALSGFIQVIKPMVFFFIGGWLILNQLDRETETAPLFKRKFLFLSIVSLVILADSVMDFIYFTGFGMGTDVGCCTTYFDLPERTTAILPVSVFGEDHERYILPIYYLSNIFLIVFLGIFYHRLSREAQPEKIQNSLNIILLVTGVFLGSINSVITIFAMFEVIAPEIMKLPGHHCIYCMWLYNPDSILMTALFILGTFSFGWALMLYFMGRDRETMHQLVRYLRTLYLAGITGLISSIIIVSIHLVGGRGGLDGM